MIGGRAGKIIDHYKMAKQFIMTIRDGYLGWSRYDDYINIYKIINLSYVIRTSEPTGRLSGADSVRSYKRLGLVERAFRCVIRDRPVGAADPPPHNRAGADAYSAVPAGLLCGVAPAPGVGTAVVRGRGVGCGPAAARPCGPGARLKKKTHVTTSGLPVQSFRTLLAHLGTRCRNTCVVTADPNQTTFRRVTEADELQAEALRLIKV